eukprot:612199-Alexandrium_andersonii.AAC.1
MIGLRFVQEQMSKEAAGGSPDPTLLSLIRGAAPQPPPASSAPAGVGALLRRRPRAERARHPH